ncbi:MAG: hypothetical protein AB7O45_18620 [Alphaproteobacteria bacterium]
MPTAAQIEAAHAFQAPPSIGHNAPPDPLAILRDNLAEKAGPLLARRREIEGRLPNVPERIDSDETAGKVADFVRLIAAAHKSAEGMRVAEKEPHLAAGRTVDGFFKAELTDPLERAKRSLEPRLTDWQRRKAEAERARRLAEEQKAREEAERAAAAARAAADTLASDADLPAAIAAEESAALAAADAEAAARAAAAKSAELSRTRGDMGAVASLREAWVGEIEDRAALDLEALRPYLPMDALQKAVNAYVRAGGRGLRGARIFKSATTVVR